VRGAKKGICPQGDDDAASSFTRNCRRATIGIFFPSFIFILVAAPLLARHGANPNVQGFVRGAYAAAIGTILGACILLGRIAIGD
jgi:chromate transport protein ChrA